MKTLRTKADRLPRRSRGFTIIELMLALGLLAVFCGIFVPLLAAITRERRIAAQEQAALQHAANVLEEITRRPLAELSATPNPAVEVPAYIHHMLPGVEQTVTAAPAEDSAPAVRVTVNLHWQSTGGTRSRVVTLSAWVHDRKGDAP
jgi:prepilin-type N-terminal cleavage/methylation domain-containing protein